MGMDAHVRTIQKTVAATLLTALAGTCGIVAWYVGSILWRSNRADPAALFGPTLPPAPRTLDGASIAVLCALVIIGIGAITGLAYIYRMRRGFAAVVRATLMIAGAWVALSAGTFFLFFTNCKIHCGERAIAGALSPNGERVAVLLEQSCVATARYCEPSYSVVVQPAHTYAKRDLEELAHNSREFVRLKWKSSDFLVVSYHGRLRAGDLPKRVGNVRIEYLPIGWM